VQAARYGEPLEMISDEDVTAIFGGIFDLRTELRLMRALLERY